MESNRGPRRQRPQAGPTGRRPLLNRVLLAGLRSPVHGLFDDGIIGLRYVSSSGHEITLPVGYVRSADHFVVLVGRSSDKTWWRHFRGREPVDVWWQGAWRPTQAQAFPVGTPEYLAGAIAYRTRHPNVGSSRDPIVLITIPAKRATAPPATAGPAHGSGNNQRASRSN